MVDWSLNQLSISMNKGFSITCRHHSGMHLYAWTLILFVATFGLFSPSLSYDLVHIDDIAYISNNTALHDGLSVAGVRHAFSLSNTSATMYMPLLWVSYMLDIEWLGASPANPWGFHFTNVLLHAANAALLLLFLHLILKNPLIAFFCAALWAWHPLRVESVAWVSERKDVLSGLFALLCVMFYLKAGYRVKEGGKSFHFTIAAILSFACGLLSKPALVPLPLALLLLDLWPLRRLSSAPRSDWRIWSRLVFEKTPFFVLAGLAGIGTVVTHHVVSGEIHVSLASRLQSVPLAYGFYVFKTILPRNLTVLYPHWDNWLTAPQTAALAMVATLTLVAVTMTTWKTRRRAPGTWIGWLWFLLLLAPVSGIIPIPTNDVADRFTYLPAMGLSIALGSAWASSNVARRAMPVLAILLVAALAILSARQLPAWQHSTSLNARVLDVFPHHATALEIKASNIMRATGDFHEANRLLTLALQSDPYHWKARIAKAQCLWALEGAEAARDFMQSSPSPTSLHTLSQWHRDLSRYNLMLGQYEEALDHAERSIELLSSRDLARIPLRFLAIQAAYENDDLPRALHHAHQFPPYADKTTLTLPDLLPHYIFQWIAGYRQDTVLYFQRLMQAYPERVDYLNNFVWGLATADWSPVPAPDVLSLAEQLASQVSAPHPGILDTLAAAQANAGRFEDAIQTIRKARSLLPAPEQDPAARGFHERLVARLNLYEQGQPYREAAFTRLFAAAIETSAAEAPPAD